MKLSEPPHGPHPDDGYTYEKCPGCEPERQRRKADRAAAKREGRDDDVEIQYKRAINEAVQKGDNDLAHEYAVGLQEYRKNYK